MIRERILKYLESESKRISKYKFYQTTGLSNGFLDKDGAIGSDKCEIIIYHYNDINPLWLLTGNGDMLLGNESTDEPNSIVYKELFEQKEKEIKELNREIGRLESKIEILEKSSKGYNIAAEPECELKKKK